MLKLKSGMSQYGGNAPNHHLILQIDLPYKTSRRPSWTVCCRVSIQNRFVMLRFKPSSLYDACSVRCVGEARGIECFHCEKRHGKLGNFYIFRVEHEKGIQTTFVFRGLERPSGIQALENRSNGTKHVSIHIS